ncbi:MAG: FAD/NAD(P)-binding oxidoreductase [Verrucomicrobiales bacterium]
MTSRRECAVLGRGAQSFPAVPLGVPLRRLDERAEIIMIERGPYVSYANCGLPYHVGRVIEKEASLLVASEAKFRNLFNVEVHTRCEVTGIAPEQKSVEIRNLATGEVNHESYDKLVLSPGAAPIRPPLPGIDLTGIFSVRTVPDAREIREWLDRNNAVRGKARRAVVCRRRLYRTGDGGELSERNLLSGSALEKRAWVMGRWGG